jgi:molybdopterin molybdotransferase
MPVLLHLPNFFKKYAGGQQEFSIAATNVLQMFETLFQDHPQLRERIFTPKNQVHPYFALFHNSQSMPRDKLDQFLLNDKDEIEVIAMAVGGSDRSDSLRDVRMRGFQQRIPVKQACQLAYGQTSTLPSESIDLTRAAGRVLTSDIKSEVNVPAFRRSAMDGYAIQAEDSFGASLYDPVQLKIVGQVLPGAQFQGQITSGQAIRIMTGAPVPEGADAVLKAEDSREENDTLLVHAGLSPHKNIGRIGEDIQAGQTVLHKGRRLRPQDIGVLASIGIGQIQVYRRARVRLIATGNELLEPGATPAGAQIVDSNSPMLSALLPRDNAVLEKVCRLPDDKEQIREALLEASADVIIATGGSSVGCEDYLPILVQEHGQLLAHGIAIRPSAPTGIGIINKKPVFLLPGNPVSCLCAYDFFAAPALRKLTGLSPDWPHRSRTLPLKRRISSQIGRVDYVRVAVIDDEVDPIAISGASVLSSTCRADGFVITPEGSEGHPKGSLVQVYFYDP